MSEHKSFDAIKAAAAADPKSFWAEAAKDVAWMKPYKEILKEDRAPFINGLSVVS